MYIIEYFNLYLLRICLKITSYFPYFQHIRISNGKGIQCFQQVTNQSLNVIDSDG